MHANFRVGLIMPVGVVSKLLLINSFLQSNCCQCKFQSLSRVEIIRNQTVRMHKRGVHGKSVVLRTDLSVNHIQSCVVVELSTSLSLYCLAASQATKSCGHEEPSD